MENVTLTLVLALFLCASPTLSYKILVFSPHFSKSHANFMRNIADTLAEAGHNVTLLVSLMSPKVNTTPSKLASVIRVSPEERVAKFFTKPEFIKHVWTNQFDFRTLLQASEEMIKIFGYTCRHLIGHKSLLLRLEVESFDLAVAELFDACAFGLMEVLKIPAHVATSATGVMDSHSMMLGIPLFPSYVPATFSYSIDRMDYLERLINFVTIWVGDRLFGSIADIETKIFQEVYGNSFISISEKIAQSTFVLTKAEPLLEFPHPTISKVVDISGLGVPKPKPLDKFWQSLVNRRGKVIIMSSGSLAESQYMPKKTKKIVLDTFAQFPGITFIWKYESDDLDLTNYTNVVISKWLPQNDLLHSSQVVAFITHAGMGSVIEAATRGVPMITIPLFAEQNRNAAMVERAGIGITLKIFDLPKEGKFFTSISTIVNNNSYIKEAKRLAKMISRRPMSAEELLIHHVEFAAEFGKLPNLDPVGRKMPFYILYMLDVFVPLLIFAVLFAFSIIFVSYRIGKHFLKIAKKEKIQ